MTKEKVRNHLNILLDKSGSMYYYVNEVKAGLKEFLQDQQDSDDTICTVSVYEFNGSVDKPVDAIHIKDLDLSFVDNYTPRGWTKLRDAIMMAIEDTDNLFSSPIKPDTIQFMIVTDGMDTSSEKTADEVKEAIEEKTDAGWIFTYQAQGSLAYNENQNLGFKSENCVQYSGQKSPDLWKMSSNKMSSYRTFLASDSVPLDEAAKQISYSEDDRKELL